MDRRREEKGRDRVSKCDDPSNAGHLKAWADVFRTFHSVPLSAAMSENDMLAIFFSRACLPVRQNHEQRESRPLEAKMEKAWKLWDNTATTEPFASADPRRASNDCPTQNARSLARNHGSENAHRASRI